MKSIIADNEILNQSLQRKWREMERRITIDMKVLKQDHLKLGRETQEARQDQLIHLKMTMREEVSDLANEWESRQSVTVTKLTNQIDQLHDKMSESVQHTTNRLQEHRDHMMRLVGESEEKNQRNEEWGFNLQRKLEPTMNEVSADLKTRRASVRANSNYSEEPDSKQ